MRITKYLDDALRASGQTVGLAALVGGANLSEEPLCPNTGTPVRPRTRYQGAPHTLVACGRPRVPC